MAAERITFADFQERFKTEEQCREYLFRQRFPHGFVCPSCGAKEYYPIYRRNLCQCKKRRKQTSVSQPVAGHSTVSVDHVNLDIVVKTAILSAVSLLDQIFEKWGDLRRIYCVFFDSRRFSRIFGDKPNAVVLIGFRNSVLSAILIHHSFGNAPLLGSFFC